MLGLLFKKNTLMAIGVLSAFAYPMFRSGELSVGKIGSWLLGDSANQQDLAYDPYRSFDVNSTFRPASIGTNTNSALPGTGGYNALPDPVQNPASKGESFADQLGGFLGTIFETQTIDSSGQVIPQAGPPTIAQAAGVNGSSVNGQTVGYRPPMLELESLPIVDIREIIRFDITPFWVQQRWPRVSAAPVSEEGYQGLRVPLTSGPGPIDLTGALTYYFDDKQVVQRIQFQGSTNQSAMLERLCKDYFQFQVIPDMPGVLAPIHDQKPCGLLKFSLPVVIDRTRPAARTQVAMEINSTKGPYQLSSMMRYIALQR